MKYSFQRIKKFFILHRIGMEVTPMDSLCVSDENHTKFHVNRTICIFRHSGAESQEIRKQVRIQKLLDFYIFLVNYSYELLKKVKIS